MKILVTETFLHYLPNGIGWIEGFHDLGHETFALQSHINNITQIDQELDLIIFMGMHTFEYEDVVKFKDRWPDTRLVAVCAGFDESYLRLKPFIEVWVEHNHKHGLIDNLFQQAGMKLIHIPLASSPNLFKQLSLEKQFDISFIGQFGDKHGHGYREQDYYLDPIINSELEGFYAGFYGYPNVNLAEVNRAYNITKVNLNFHYPNQKLESNSYTDSVDFNSRVFDIAMSKNFQLCDHPHIKELFNEGVQYTSKEDWVDAVHYYVANEDARLMLAEKAYQECLTKHTWKVRMAEFLNKIAE